LARCTPILKDFLSRPGVALRPLPLSFDSIPTRRPGAFRLKPDAFRPTPFAFQTRPPRRRRRARRGEARGVRGDRGDAVDDPDARFRRRVRVVHRRDVPAHRALARGARARLRRVPSHTGSHTTASAW
jgi:hypothetical protein